MRQLLALLFLTTFISTFGQKVTSVETPIKTVERVFKDYIKYSESTDSPDDKEAISKAVKSLQESSKETDLPLLINVWMYYDPTDFSTRELIEPIFHKNKMATINAINKRIKNKKEWENKDTAPFSELFDLKDKLLKGETGMLILDSKKAKAFINPTGSYKLENKTTVKNGDTYGYFGEIDIKLLDSSKIAISFFVCKGAPSYNMGAFIDTLTYRNNIAIHTTPEDDTTCRITFTFTKKSITVDQYQADLNFGCAFGHGVFADGFYKKTSSKIPVIADIEDKYNGTNGILPKN